jgi:hypothetical protein
METSELYSKYLNYDVSLEEVIELLIKNGTSMALLDDDAGHFAVSTSGMQNVVEDEPIDVVTTFMVEKSEWKNSVREAVLHFLNEFE